MAQITSSMVKELREMTGSAMMDCKKALVETSGDIEAAKELLRKKGQTIANKKSSRETKEGAISIFLNEEQTESALIKVACETDFVAINDKFKEFIASLSSQALETGTDDFMEKKTSKGLIKDQITNAIAELGENIVFLEGEKWESSANSIIGSYTHTNGKIGVMVEVGSASALENKDELKVLAKDIAMHIAASQVLAIREEDIDPAALEKERLFLIEQAKESGKPQEIAEKMVVGRMKKYKKEICLLEQPFVKNGELTIAKLLAAKQTELGVQQLEVKRFFKSSF